MEYPERTLRRKISTRASSWLTEIRANPNELHVILNPSCTEPNVNSNCSSLQFNNSNHSINYVLSDSDDESDCESNPSFTESGDFKKEFIEWALVNNVTHSALKQLLYLLRARLPNEDIPHDPRTLLSTGGYKILQNMGSGKFYYFGIEQAVVKRVQNLSLDGLPNLSTFKEFESCNIVMLTVGFDGLPLSRSSRAQLWPLLGYINQNGCQSPFLIACYFGYEKPPVNEYLVPFIQEVKKLEAEGLVVNNVKYNFRIRCFIADAPARNMLKATVAFNAYHGCERCVQRGKWKGRVIFTHNDSELRTDESFVLKVDSAHHKGPSPLEDLKVGLVTQFVLDYQHLCCLGVMRKILYVLLRGPIPYRISSTMVDKISDRIIKYRKFIPQDFCRKGRS